MKRDAAKIRVSRQPPPDFIPCTPPPSPMADVFELARVAVEQNPANAPPMEAMAALMMTAIVPGISSPDDLPIPQFIAVATSKYWGPKTRELGVSFLDQTGPTTRGLILSHMNAWSDRIGISFKESSRGEVRISRGNGGYWSYLGTDILSIPADRPTMNLEAFTDKTPDSEYRRVVRHETGHTLGCPHEHMRRSIIELIDPSKAVAYFRRTSGWSQSTVIEQVLTPIEESSLMGTPTAEQDSIMAYQFPASITKNGKPIVGGSDITESDSNFMAKLYPKADSPAPPPVVQPPVEPPVIPPPIVQPPVVTAASATMPVLAQVPMALDWLQVLGHQVTPPATGSFAVAPVYVEVAKVIDGLKTLGYQITR